MPVKGTVLEEQRCLWGIYKLSRQPQFGSDFSARSRIPLFFSGSEAVDLGAAKAGLCFPTSDLIRDPFVWSGTLDRIRMWLEEGVQHYLRPD